MGGVKVLYVSCLSLRRYKVKWSVFTWRRLSPAGHSRTRCWRRSEAWWVYFSPMAAGRPPRCPAICCGARTEDEESRECVTQHFHNAVHPTAIYFESVTYKGCRYTLILLNDKTLFWFANFLLFWLMCEQKPPVNQANMHPKILLFKP